MPLSFPSGHILAAAQDTEKAGLLTKVSVHLMATDSQIIQQTQKRGAKSGAKRGAKREVQERTRSTAAWEMRGPRVVLGSIPPPSLNLFTFSTTALLNSSKMPSYHMQSTVCTDVCSCHLISTCFIASVYTTRALAMRCICMHQQLQQNPSCRCCGVAMPYNTACEHAGMHPRH